MAAGYRAWKRAGRPHEQGSHLEYPEYQTALTWGRAVLKALEESVEGEIQRTKPASGNVVLDTQTVRAGWQSMEFHLLWHQVVLLAMKHGRAPLHVTPSVWKGLQRCGVLNDLYDLGSIARRLSFLGDGRLLLDELKLRNAMRSPGEQTVSEQIDQRGGSSVERG